MMGVRLYWGRVLQSTSHYPVEITGGEPEYRFQLIRHHKMLGVYGSSSLAGLRQLLIDDGHQVWGCDILDYITPKTAWESEVIKEIERLRKDDQSS